MRDRETFTRLRHGFRDHLRHFAAAPRALAVYVYALIARDHETGELRAHYEDIAEATGLSGRQVRAALAWLRHGCGCPCADCRRLDPLTDRPRYLELVSGASRGTPPTHRILRDDSLSRARRDAERAGQLSLVQGGRP